MDLDVLTYAKMPLHILHSSPASSIPVWDKVDFTSSNIVLSAVNLSAEQREILLKRAVDAAKRTTVVLYTGISTSDCNAPCGCWGYTDVCWYHRYTGYAESPVAECYCSMEYDVCCSYHEKHPVADT